MNKIAGAIAGSLLTLFAASAVGTAHTMYEAVDCSADTMTTAISSNGSKAVEEKMIDCGVGTMKTMLGWTIAVPLLTIAGGIGGVKLASRKDKGPKI